MVPKKVIDVAAIKSEELETTVEKRKLQSLYVQSCSACFYRLTSLF